MRPVAALCTILAVAQQAAGLRGARPARSRVVASTVGAPPELSTADLCRLFGRLADKVVLMDESSGACCHSGCDGCPYRYSFDVLEAVAPKWLCTYVTKTIGERQHTPRLIATAFGESKKVTRSDFAERVAQAKYELPIGPALPAAERIALKNAPELSVEVASALFSALAGGADASSLSVVGAAKRLREWSAGKDGLMFDEFCAAFRAASQGLHDGEVAEPARAPPRAQPVMSAAEPTRAEEREGKIVFIATDEMLAALSSPLVIDARRPSEVAGSKGGEAYAGSVNVPFFDEGSEVPPSLDEYRAKLEAAGCLPAAKDAPIVTHCGGGGRGQKTADMIRALGYTNVHNGKNPDTIRAARAA